MYDYNRIGSCVKNARVSKRLSQETLAELVDITPTHIKHIESGHRRPSVELLFQLFNVLELSFEELQTSERKNTLCRSTLDILLNDCSAEELQLIYKIVAAIHL